MKRDELNDILEKHKKWLQGERGGERADLAWADLTEANLARAKLARAKLAGANLTGANLYEANLTGADLTEADLTEANLTGADLTRADLAWANLIGADLYGADLARAVLTEANLTEANLYEANLYGAKGINKYRTTSLYILADQPGKIRAYKLVNAKSEGIYRGGIKYEVGQSYSVDEYDGDEQSQCGAGINLATLDWCLRYYQPGYRILIAEFTAKDIVAIPIGSDGKFRVKRCKIVREKDLVELGLEGNK